VGAREEGRRKGGNAPGKGLGIFKTWGLINWKGFRRINS